MKTIEELKAALGKALLEGDVSATDSLKKELAKAEAAASASAVEHEAVEAAKALLEKKAAEKIAADAAAELAKRWKQAETDLHDLHATVAAKDRVLAKLAELNQREAHQARTFANSYADLGMHSNVRDEILHRSWNGQLIQKLKTDVGLGGYLPKLLTYGVPGRAVTACVPAFNKVFRSAPKLALEHKEAA